MVLPRAERHVLALGNQLRTALALAAITGEGSDAAERLLSRIAEVSGDEGDEGGLEDGEEALGMPVAGKGGGAGAGSSSKFTAQQLAWSKKAAKAQLSGADFKAWKKEKKEYRTAG